MSGTARFARDPLGELTRLRRERGEVFEIELAFAGRSTVVADPAAVAAIVDSDPGRAHAGEARRAVLPMASPRSVLGGDEEIHRDHRRQLAQVLAPSALARRHEEIAAIARRHAEEWPRGRPIQLLSRLRTLLDEVFVRVILGVEGREEATAIRDALGAMLRTPGNPPVPPPAPDEGPLGKLVAAIFEPRRRRFAGLLTAAVERRRAQPRDPSDLPADAIEALLGPRGETSTEEVVEELVTLAMAAQEPPSVALGWLLDRLARSPGLAADYIAAGDGSPLREAVLDESLRLRPSALAVLRKLTVPLKAGGHEIDAGTSVLLPLPLLHRDPAFFAAPDAFRPERWLDGADSPAVFLPFGGGARACVGEPLARAEIAAVVPAVLGSARLRPLWPRRERMVLRATTLVPHRSLPAVVS